VKGFRDLLIWEKAHRLTLNAYVATRSFPREEMYGLTVRFADARPRWGPISQRAAGTAAMQILPGS